MTRAQAHNLLDERRAGADMPEHVVLKALEVTGDYVPEYGISEAIREIAQEREAA